MTAHIAWTAGLAAGLLLTVSSVAADPIVAGPLACYGAAWVAAEGVDCSSACSGLGMTAEGIPSGPSLDQTIFMCRLSGPGTPGFGEQALGKCRVGLADGFLAEFGSFECLCVTKESCPDGPTGDVPQPSFAEDCLAFNTAALSVLNIDGRWKIVEGQNWMFDFADNEAEAREAFKTIHLNGFNQVCYIGRPAPSMTYLKTGPRVPGGDAEGFDCIPFDPSSVGVSQEGSEWLLSSSGSRMLMFPSEAEARSALSVISTYQLNRQCFVGRPGPSFEFWLAR